MKESFAFKPETKPGVKKNKIIEFPQTEEKRKRLELARAKAGMAGGEKKHVGVDTEADMIRKKGDEMQESAFAAYQGEDAQKMVTDPVSKGIDAKMDHIRRDGDDMQENAFAAYQVEDVESGTKTDPVSKGIDAKADIIRREDDEMQESAFAAYQEETGDTGKKKAEGVKPEADIIRREDDGMQEGAFAAYQGEIGDIIPAGEKEKTDAKRETRKNMGRKIGKSIEEKDDGRFKMGEEKDAAYSPEEKEKLGKLEELRILVEEKRKGYAAEDYRTTNIFTKLKSVLGMKTENLPTGAKDSFAYQQYQGALNELRNLQIQAMRDKYANMDSLPPAEKAAAMTEMKKEMGDMATYFGFTEKLDLAGARTDARTASWSETKMGRFGEKALKIGAELINKYRTLDPRIKTGIAVALFAAGGYAAFTGSAVAVAGVTGVNLVRRWLGGAVLGTSVTAGLEARSRNKVNKKAGKDKNEMMGNVERSLQEHIQALNEYCGKEMKTYHDGLQKEKSQARNRKLIGAGVAVAVGSGAAGWLIGKGFGLMKDGATSLWEHVNVGGADESGGLAFASEPAPVEVGTNPIDHADSAHEATHAGASDGDRFNPKMEATHAGASDGDRFSSVEAPVSAQGASEYVAAKGDSVERIMINQKIAEGMSPHDAETLAHQIASNPDNEETLKELGKIKPGQKVIVDWEKGTVKVDRILGAHVNTPDVPAGGTEVHQPSVEKVMPVGPDVSPTPEAPVSAGVAPDVEPHSSSVDSGVRAQEGVENSSPNSNAQSHASADGDRMHQELNNEYQKVYGKGGAEILRNIQSMPESMQSHRGELLDLGRLKAAAEEAYTRAVSDTNDVSGARAAALESAKGGYEKAYAKAFNSLARETFAGQQIEGGVAGLKAVGAAEFLGSENGQSSKIVELKGYVAKQFGTNFSNPLPGENMFSWTTRMIKSSLEAGGVEYKNFKLLDRGGK
ncbi:MAG: hypothetical protein WAV73_02045 [Candidatus Moraniibacteriota bacterium]